MKIWTISDLHIPTKEALALRKPDRFPDADVCIVAGDVCDSLNAAVNWLGKVIRPRMPVIWTIGNHEFYGASIEGGRKNAAFLARALGVTLLDDTSAVIDGVRFVGGTLWTDFAIGIPSDAEQRQERIRTAMGAAKRGLSDFVNIYLQEYQRDNIIPRLLLPKDTAALHETTKKFIVKSLSDGFDGKTVVVTHHAPHPNSIHEKFKGDDTNGAFVSDLSDVIDTYKPAAWIHGHVHQEFDYWLGASRIVCNPRGYRLENESFDFFKVIEV